MACRLTTSDWVDEGEVIRLWVVVDALGVESRGFNFMFVYTHDRRALQTVTL